MKTVVDELKSTQTLRKACEFYMRTPKFASISGKSQIDYERNLSKACSTKVQSGRMLGNIKLKDISFKHVTLVINTAFRHEAILSNPVSLIKRTKSKPRKVKWTTPQVKLFIDTAYSDWRWRSIGLIVHMAFHWAQRIGDMRTLEWSSLDLVNNTMALEQSKRGTDVFIPIQGGLIDVLRQQEKDFGFQPYVVPRVNPRAGSYSPYDDHEICGLVNEVKEVAGLPKNLTAMDLRRTAITQMVENGLDAVGIMQVSGHANPQSIKPYLVNTLTGATTAQACREDELI